MTSFSDRSDEAGRIHSGRPSTAPMRENGRKQGSARDQICVLHVLDKFTIDGRSLHGVARLMSWWVNAIDRQHFELNVLGLRAPSEAGRHVERQGGKVFYSDRGKLSPISIFDILEVARQTGADLLHLHGYKASTMGRIAGKILDVPVILHEHGAFPSIPLHQKVADWLLNPLGNKAIVVSEAVKEFCVTHRSMDPDRIEVIPNGIPLDDFRNVSDEEVEQVAGELNLDSGVPIIGTVTRLDEGKGIPYLLDAVPMIKSRLPRAKFLFVGDGKCRAELEDKAAQLGVANDVAFTGERRDVPRLYKLMDVKVIPSLHEGGPLTLFEAMAAGTPVVATPVGIVANLIENGKTGMLVQPREPAEIAEAVVDLLQNGERYQKIADRAQGKVREYDLQHSMRRIEAVYQEVLE